MHWFSHLDFEIEHSSCLGCSWCEDDDPRNNCTVRQFTEMKICAIFMYFMTQRLIRSVPKKFFSTSNILHSRISSINRAPLVLTIEGNIGAGKLLLTFSVDFDLQCHSSCWPISIKFKANIPWINLIPCVHFFLRKIYVIKFIEKGASRMDLRRRAPRLLV